MSTYAIGDIQGCFAELEKLLDVIHFDNKDDILWFAGDLVNRGPASLQTLRFIKSLGNHHKVVLGNHDLHLLAVAYDLQSEKRGDTLGHILAAPDRDDLIDWLRHCPLLHHDQALGYVMTHAGLSPAWTLSEAKLLAQEVEEVLCGETPEFLLQNMYGNLPDRWDNNLAGSERLRCIVNFLTRMRFCHADGRLDLTYRGEIADKPDDLIPWFDVPGRLNADEKIIFGHWAALNGKTPAGSNLFALDTGCVWGNCLTAMRLEDKKRFNVKCG